MRARQGAGSLGFLFLGQKQRLVSTGNQEPWGGRIRGSTACRPKQKLLLKVQNGAEESRVLWFMTASPLFPYLTSTVLEERTQALRETDSAGR